MNQVNQSKRLYKNPLRITRFSLKKTNSAKVVKPRLGFSPPKLKIHRETSRHITIEKANQEAENQVKPLRSFVFNEKMMHTH